MVPAILHKNTNLHKRFRCVCNIKRSECNIDRILEHCFVIKVSQCKIQQLIIYNLTEGLQIKIDARLINAESRNFRVAPLLKQGKERFQNGVQDDSFFRTRLLNGNALRGKKRVVGISETRPVKMKWRKWKEMHPCS